MNNMSVSPRVTEPKTPQDKAYYMMKLANIPEKYRPEMSIYLQQEIAKSGKSFNRLVELFGHPCTKDILGSSITKLDSNIEQVKSAGVPPDFLAQHRATLLKGIAAILGSGFDSVMKNELEYSPSGVPTGVGEKSRDRHPVCDSALSGRQINKDVGAGIRKRKTRKIIKKKRKTLRRIRHKVY